MLNRGECLPGISKPSRLGAVWMTYWTRPMFWLFALVLIVAAFLMVMIELQSPRNWHVLLYRPVATTPTPNLFFGDKQKAGTKIESCLARSLNVGDTQNHREIFGSGSYPHLESLTIRGFVSDVEVETLCRIYDLKSLALPFAAGLTDRAFTALKNETSLEFLEVGLLGIDLPTNEHPISTSKALSWPPNLRSLVFSEPRGIPIARFREWQKLPQLNSLCIAFGEINSGLTQEAIGVIKTFPQLKTLFLGDANLEAIRSHIQGSFGDLETSDNKRDLTALRKSVQHELPRITVRSTSIFTGAQRAVTPIFIFAFILFVPLLVHLTSQFLATSRALTPCYEFAHLAMAVSLLMALAGITFWLMVHRGCPILPAMGLCGFSLFVVALNQELCCGFQEYHINRANPGILLATYSYMMIPQWLWMSGIVGPNWNRFLNSEFPGIAVVMFFASAWGGIRLLGSKPGLLRITEELGLGQLPMSLPALNGWKSEVQRIQARKNGNCQSGTSRFFFSRKEPLDNQSPKAIRLSTPLLWQQSFPPGSLGGLIIVPVSVVFGLFAVAILRSQIEDMYARAIYSAILVACSAMLLSPFQIVAGRGDFHMTELLRPITRRDWRSTWFYELARKSIVPLITLVVIVIGVGLTEIPDEMTLTRIAMMALFQVGIALGLYSLGMIVLTLNSRIGRGVVFGALFGLMIPIQGTIYTLRFRRDLAPIAFQAVNGISITIVTYLVATALFWVAWRRWMTWEVGRDK